ncbi:MAG TPA: hypothetical protein GX734_01810 [Clostridiaceae bacterium]|nr:hypothetical protein [Clostridiaceae bacterium]
MTPAEVTRFLYILGGALVGLALLAVVLTVVRRSLEKRVRVLVAQNRNSLVGKRALVVSVIRPLRLGSIRPLGTPSEEADRALARRKKNQLHDVVYPATSDELISKGRVVRVTGGDANRYIVRSL